MSNLKKTLLGIGITIFIILGLMGFGSYKRSLHYIVDNNYYLANPIKFIETLNLLENYGIPPFFKVNSCKSFLLGYGLFTGEFPKSKIDFSNSMIMPYAEKASTILHGAYNSKRMEINIAIDSAGMCIANIMITSQYTKESANAIYDLLQGKYTKDEGLLTSGLEKWKESEKGGLCIFEIKNYIEKKYDPSYSEDDYLDLIYNNGCINDFIQFASDFTFMPKGSLGAKK